MKNRTKRLLAIGLIAAMTASLAACSSEGSGGATSGSDDKQTEAGSGKIGVAMPTKDLQRWNQDGENMKKQLEDAGYEYLAKYMFKVSISEMHHAEHIAERILFLGGDADMNPCDPTRQLTDVGDMLQLAVKLETSTVESYNAATRESAAMGDTVTSRMFQDMASEEEHHLDDFRTEMKNLQEYGELYLTMQSVGRSKERAKG